MQWPQALYKHRFLTHLVNKSAIGGKPGSQTFGESERFGEMAESLGT